MFYVLGLRFGAFTSWQQTNAVMYGRRANEILRGYRQVWIAFGTEGGLFLTSPATLFVAMRSEVVRFGGAPRITVAGHGTLDTSSGKRT